MAARDRPSKFGQCGNSGAARDRGRPLIAASRPRSLARESSAAHNHRHGDGLPSRMPGPRSGPHRVGVSGIRTRKPAQHRACGDSCETRVAGHAGDADPSRQRSTSSRTVAACPVEHGSSRPRTDFRQVQVRSPLRSRMHEDGQRLRCSTNSMRCKCRLEDRIAVTRLFAVIDRFFVALPRTTSPR